MATIIKCDVCGAVVDDDADYQAAWFRLEAMGVGHALATGRHVADCCSPACVANAAKAK